MEYVNQQSDDEVIFVGVKTNFVFIGTKEIFNKDIQAIDKKCLETHKRQLETTAISLEFERAKDEPIGAVISEYYDSFGNKRIRRLSYEKAVESYWKNIRRMETTIAELDKYIKEYTPIWEREVVVSYKRNELRDGFVVLVDGLEIGKYWLKEEYDTGYVEESVTENE